jgi:hypothetical protein
MSAHTISLEQTMETIPMPTNVRAGQPLFNIVFPIVFGALMWGGLWLRDQRLRVLLPLRQQS